MSEFLTLADVAERYQISKASVYHFVRDGHLPRGLKLGKTHRWPLSQLEAFEKELTNTDKKQ